MTSLGRHTRPACHPGSTRDVLIKKKVDFDLHRVCFSWLLGCEGSGATFHGLRRPACHQALFSLKLCKECGSNSCVRVFLIPWGHVNNHDHIWAFVTSMGSPDLNARFWLVDKISAALWLVRTYCSLYHYSRSFSFPPNEHSMMSWNAIFSSFSRCEGNSVKTLAICSLRVVVRENRAKC